MTLLTYVNHQIWIKNNLSHQVNWTKMIKRNVDVLFLTQKFLSEALHCIILGAFLSLLNIWNRIWTQNKKEKLYKKKKKIQWNNTFFRFSVYWYVTLTRFLISCKNFPTHLPVNTQHFPWFNLWPQSSPNLQPYPHIYPILNSPDLWFLNLKLKGEVI